MIVTYSNRTYRITYQSIALVENALENPNLIQISLTADCEVKVAPMPEYDINYLPNGEYRSWQLTGINTRLNRKEQHFIYARLERASKDALLVFSVNDYNVDGTTGEGTEPSEYYYYIKLGKITATDAVEGATVMREVTLDYGYLATPADRTENFFQLRTDANGNEYIITKYHVVSEQSYTSYATPQTQVPSLFDGIPIDNGTIYWEETDGVRILKAKGGGGEEGTINEETLWQILAKPGSQQISSTHLTDALKNYITVTSVDEKISEATENFVTLDSEQEIAALKHFTDGLSVGAGKHKIYEKDGVVYFEGDLAVTGGITQYALGDTPVSTIMDGIVTDNVTIKKENGKLVVIGGSGSDFDKAAMWKALAADTAEQINKTHLTDALAAYATITDVDDRIDDLINGAPAAFDTLKEIADVLQGNVDSIGDIFEVLETKWTQDDTKIANWDAAFGWGNHAEAGYAHLANEETFTGLKHFSVGLTVGEGKHKLYEKDGVVYFDGDLAVTGGITQYALGDTPVSTIMDGVATDNVTIKKENGKLVVIGGGGSSFDDAQMWAALSAATNEQINRSHLTTALQGYATESWANSNFLGKTDKAVDSDKVDGEHNGDLTSRYWNPTSPVDDLNNYRHNGFAAWSTVSVNRPYEYGTLFQFSNMVTPTAGTNNHWVNQIAFGTNNRVYARQRINTGAWSSWSNIAYLSDTIPQAENSNKLQNLTWSDFFSRGYHYLDYGSQSTSNFYPVFFFPNDIELDCEIHSDSVSSADAYNQNRIHFQLTSQGWSDTGVSFRILSINNFSDSEITIGAIGYGTKDGGIAIWVRGGKRYRLYCNKTPNMKTSDFTYGSNGEKYTVGTNLDGGTNSSVNIIWKNDSNRNNGLVATVDGNVYSATKLQNTRTIWGQSFNGEQNVNGDLREVNNIYTNRGVIDAFTFGYSPYDNHDGLPWYGFGYYGNNKIGISGYGGIDFFTSAGNTLSLSSNGRTYANSVVCSDWVRTTENTGWYSENWGGGWFMSDSTYIRTYNNKAVVALRYDADQGLSGSAWNNGNAAFSVRIHNNENQTPLLLAYRNGTADTGENRLFALELLNSGTQLAFGMGGKAVMSLSNQGGVGCSSVTTNYDNSGLDEYSIYNSPFWQNRNVINYSKYRYILGWEDACPQGWNTGYGIGTYRTSGNDWGSMTFEVCQYEGTKTRKAQMELRGSDNTFWCSGNILAVGGITQYSDKRAKTILEQITLSLQSIANSPAVRFKWNGWKQKDDGKTHIGGIAQYVQKILPEAIYNSEGVLTMDYATTGYIFAVQTARHLLKYETKTEKEIKQLKQRVKYLEKQLKKLGYEETGTLAN